jgi:two-component sensor histidine kinase
MIWVSVLQTDKQTILVSVRDGDVGLPIDFDPTMTTRLGTRLVNELSKQLRAKLTRPMCPVGTTFELFIPLSPATTE